MMTASHSFQSPLNRREFLMLLGGAGIAFCAGCTSLKQGAPPPVSGHPPRVVDAGLRSTYSAEGLYTVFRDQGFFLVTKNGKTEAISSICTHRSCLLDAEPDRSFFCPCHGSTFSPEGKVTEGPATRDLPVLETSLAPNGHVLVKVPAV
jgi:Rieske Fe-S protein